MTAKKSRPARRRTPRLGKGERREHQFYLSPALDEKFNKRCKDLGVSSSLYVCKLVEQELAARSLKPEDFDRT